MRFLSVADRELRCAARQKSTYRARWITAALFFALLVWLLWVMRHFSNAQAAAEIFKVFAVLSFLYCLFVSTARTADCISAERREGTLGLLFLTNLNSAEIIAGKLCSSALASVYGLMAIFPMLALPFLMGGVSFGYFWRTLLALVNGILLALAVGFLASVACKRQFTAIALAMGSMLALVGGLMVGAVAADAYARTRPLAHWIAGLSPLYALLTANGAPLFGPNRFWPSTAAVAGISAGCVGLTTLLLAGTWRDRPRSILAWRPWRLGRRRERSRSTHQAGLRRRLLGINPLFWLAARQAVSSPVFMALAVALVLFTVYVTAPFFGRVLSSGATDPVAGHVFAWLWTGLAVHALVLYYAAMMASQRLAEDRQSGALELILSTPTSERTLSRGLWLAFGRQMLFPGLLAVLVHLFFVWTGLVLATLDPPGPLPNGITAGEFFWSALRDQPVRGQLLDWHFGYLLRTVLLILPQLMLVWVALGWLGRWLGLRLKHPGFAPMASLALLGAPPVALFTLACYLADRWNVFRLPERQILPLLTWLAFALVTGNSVVLAVWAALRLRRALRAVAMSRYQSLPGWRWRLPTWRAVRPMALTGAAVIMVPVLLVVAYYRYENWRSQRAWRDLQSALKQSGESLEVSGRLPGRVPDEANFARAPVFRELLSGTNQGGAFFRRLRPFTLPANEAQLTDLLMDWTRQTNAPLLEFVDWASLGPRGSRPAMPVQQAAAAIPQGLATQGERLREVAAAVARCPLLQLSTNRDAGAVFYPGHESTLLLTDLHLLFQARACAELALGWNAEAAEDALTGLRLARLARQLSDPRAIMRVQTMLARSLQPLWEGFSRHAWTEPDLASMQNELAGFNLLADYTNAVSLVVLAHIEVWQKIPSRPGSRIDLPGPEGGYRQDPAWQLQPRGWWLANCVQLHEASLQVIQQVDMATGRIRPANNWADISGLPLDDISQQLLEESFWWGANPASVAFVQTSVNQASIACALERFRLSHGVYPETLQALVPALLPRLPHDAVSGRPVIYQALGEGAFILRGVGPNETDDRKSASSDDWLWAYSTNSPSAKR